MSNVHTAVILAAGKSTRTYPLTLDTPKCLLKVINKTIIERTLDELDRLVEEVILIVGFKKEKIEKFLGRTYKFLSLKYVEQKELNGTGAAILELKDKLHGKFLVLNGDDLYAKKDIMHLLQYDYAVLGQKVKDPKRFGVFVTDNKGNLQNIIEKPNQFIGDLVNTGCYLLDEKIFHHRLQKSKRGEYEIVDYLLFLAKKYGVHVVPVTQYWLSIGYPLDLLEANRFLLTQEYKNQSTGILKNSNSNNIKMSEPVFIGNNVLLGKNTKLIGPVIIEDDVVMEDNCTLDDSLVTQGSIVKKKTTLKKAIVTPEYTLSFPTSLYPRNPAQKQK